MDAAVQEQQLEQLRRERMQVILKYYRELRILHLVTAGGLCIITILLFNGILSRTAIGWAILVIGWILLFYSWVRKLPPSPQQQLRDEEEAGH